MRIESSSTYILEHRYNSRCVDRVPECYTGLYRNVVEDRLTELTGKLSIYSYKLATNQWHSRLRTQKHTETLLDTVDTGWALFLLSAPSMAGPSSMELHV